MPCLCDARSVEVVNDGFVDGNLSTFRRNRETSPLKTVPMQKMELLLTQGGPENRATLGFVVERFQRTRKRKLSSREADYFEIAAATDSFFPLLDL